MCVWFESSEFDYIFLVDFDVRRTRRIESDGEKQNVNTSQKSLMKISVMNYAVPDRYVLPS